MALAHKKRRRTRKDNSSADAMATEYKTLRDEILQLYREQAQLAFVSPVPLLGSLLIKDISLFDGRWLILAAALILLGGISWKIRSNYYKIFCLGTYLAVVHERKGQDPTNFRPGPAYAGWHTRWRKIDANPARYPELKGQLGRATAQADAVFLSAIACAQIFLTVGRDIAAWTSIFPQSVSASDNPSIAILLLVFP